MESSRKLQTAVILLLVLIVATGMAPAAVQAERECEKDSERFVGACMIAENCANVCKGEGFSGGRCSTFRRRCICTKPC